ncbi:baculoviral IAP repeat-containing protein 5-like [Pipistrellus kuhlii]|uniref:baculoviral IAP repeat-containing protein 5-like n=1 Tax=Pipistrellus kuhlii TaxID=59472 RepID=UPI00174F39FF|nr:baculoviral IAP repeat-containing protein 5-like [Pipistrellus kuhlii]
MTMIMMVTMMGDDGEVLTLVMRKLNYSEVKGIGPVLYSRFWAATLNRHGWGWHCSTAWWIAAVSLPEAWQVYGEDHRLATFRHWPFQEGCACTPERMAAAGFIHCPTENEPNLIECFFCFKELEGWEPEDDPAEEHRKHSPGCAFLCLRKRVEELSFGEFLELDKERTKNRIMKEVHRWREGLEEVAKKVRSAIERQLADPE